MVLSDSPAVRRLPRALYLNYVVFRVSSWAGSPGGFWTYCIPGTWLRVRTARGIRIHTCMCACALAAILFCENAFVCSTVFAFVDGLIRKKRCTSYRLSIASWVTALLLLIFTTFKRRRRRVHVGNATSLCIHGCYHQILRRQA